MKLIIIGAGPGGYETAVEAARRGIEVVLISDGPLGGTCLNEGCIPTKTLLHAAEQLPEGETPADAALATAQKHKRAVVEQLRGGIALLLGNKLITLVEGHASFAGPHCVTVPGPEGERRFEGDAILVAVGSVSASLPIPGADLPGVLSSREILELERVPRSLCIIGGGVIGLEFASLYRSFGAEVTVLEYAPSLLPRFDTDLSKRLRQALVRRGIAVETSARVEAIDGGDAFSVRFSDKSCAERSVAAECVLMAVGRRAALSSLNFEAIGIECSPRGVVVDDNFETSVPGVYAVGDVTGRMMLAHEASAQGLRALNHICLCADGGSGVPDDGLDFSIIPAAVFTTPELACVGLSEEDCKASGQEFRALKAFYRANGKAVSMDAGDGYCKVLADPVSGRILGAHILGAHASDLIHEAAALMQFGVDAKRAGSLIHAHPTLSEVLQAALRSF